MSRRLARTLALPAFAGAVLAAGASPAQATSECRALPVCVPVSGPWVVVPAGRGAPRPRVEYQLSCPRGYVVGGLDAELSDPAIDIAFLATLGSPVNPGISTSRAAVFVASSTATPARLSSFRPHVGCIPGAGGGQRTPTAASMSAPGHPAVRRVWELAVRPGRPLRATRTCAASERLVSASHAVGFYTARPPAAPLASSVAVRQVIRGEGVAVTVRAGAVAAGVRAVVQLNAVCAGGR